MVGTEAFDATSSAGTVSGATVLPALAIADAMARYTQYMTAGDLEGVMSLFAPDAVLRDPIVDPEHRGIASIRAFFAGKFSENGGAIEMRLEGAVRVSGNHGAAMVAHARAGDLRIRCDTLDVMTFDHHGKVVDFKAYFGPSNITMTAAS